MNHTTQHANLREATTMLATVFESKTMEFVTHSAESAPRLHLLVVDPDAAVRSACAEIASGLGYAADTTGDMAQARSVMRGRAADILLVNLPAGSMLGLELIAEIKLLHPQTAIIAMTASASVNAAVEAMRCGASDYLIKPFAMDELSTVLDRAAAIQHTDAAARQLRELLRASQGLGSMIGRSGEMEKLYRILSKVAQSSHPVLILGESGTGKELVARTLHAYGPNAQKPFLPVDCSSLVPTLMESELFGYVRGAFTGANQARDGLLVSAGGGTVFLRPSCCARCRRRKSGPSAPRIAFPSMRASWPPPIATWPPWWKRAHSARTCSIASTS
jgi:DNA-binding NtrC family response regulator